MGAGTLVGMGVTVLLGVTVGADCVGATGAHLRAAGPAGPRGGGGQVWTGPE